MKEDNKNKLLGEAELIVAEKEIKDILNKGFNICCPKCHSTDYDIYPTGGLSKEHCIRFGQDYGVANDIYYKCNKCGEIFRSGFIK
jgi:hypothetical protein